MPGAGRTRGLLLINLGTPDAPTTSAVRRYLCEFLSDGRVLDIPPLRRWLVLNAFILPFRPARSAAAYKKIWTERGSPLLFHSQDLTEKVSQALKGQFEVELGMRYGHPSLEEALDRLARRHIEELTVLPLYPLNAASSTSSSLARVYELIARRWEVLPVHALGPFFDAPGFLTAFATTTQEALTAATPDFVLFSFHGLPERQIKKSDPSRSHCLSSNACCETLTTLNRNCYRAQAYFVARALASKLGLSKDRYDVAFQSRLGRTPWIKPFTDELLPTLVGRGHRRVAVVCPSFVADCLETVEEIAIRGKEMFLAAGGEELTLVPSLNSSPLWVEAVVQWARASAGIGVGEGT